VKTGTARGEFKVLMSTQSAQCAKMTLKSGGCSDDEPRNEHPGSEQWLFVVSGTGEAIAKNGETRQRMRLAANSLLLIEKRELHQIRNTGRRPLVTINFYVPPAYRSDGEPVKRNK
jgi:mannose-6-phosphate isomerase-like protein (cupin superfamily)